jgi:hypothetical protein
MPWLTVPNGQSVGLSWGQVAVHQDRAEIPAAHIWTSGAAWFVGAQFDSGLPVSTRDAALEIADLWLRLTGARALVVREADGTVWRSGQADECEQP